MATNSTSTPNSEPTGGVPKAEPRPIYLRAYAEPPAVAGSGKGGGFDAEPSHWTVIFDCETTPDVDQRLRFGSYQIRAGGVLKEKGLFYDPDAVDEDELAELQTHRPPGLKLRTLRSFVEEVFFDIGYQTDAVIVGFNLPFDISRLAIGHQSARLVRRTNGPADRSMVGGFTFKLSDTPGRPNVRVKHLSRRAAFINFAAPGDTKVGEKVNRGFFVDVKTLAAALTTRSFNLRRLAIHLGVQEKEPFEQFDRKIDREFMEYAAQDAETTWCCYEALIEQYDAHGLWKKQASRIYSEASLGKAYLAAMGVNPWLRQGQIYSAVSIGRIMSAYYGGRAEVHHRREVVRTAYCDFASMYPTVCTLMGLWRFVIAEGVEEYDATDDTQALLNNFSLDQLRDPDFWPKLRVLVEVKPDADIFPVRARYGEGPSNTIGVNYLSADRTLWFTLADCIASTLLAGKPPEVVSAVRYEPTAVQEGLGAVSLAGTEHVVHPARDDFYRRVIDIRREVKAQEKAAKDRGAPAVEVDRLGAEQLGLKILANATSYGVFIELNVEDAEDEGEEVRVHGADEPFTVEAKKVERPGRFFHPVLATLITGAARLMLAITERRAIDAGLDWAFCDTDSMAFAMPEGMEADDFMQRVDGVRDWFTPLNPYEEKGSILELEKQNLDEDENALEPLFCFAVSAKRYALFNRRADGIIVIRKASAHGLGHLSAPYGEDDPDAPLRASGVRPWQEDVWRAIITAADEGHTRNVPLDWHEDLKTRAASQHTASTPDLLRPFRHLNADKPYVQQIRPFGFMLWFHSKRREDTAWTGDGGDGFDPRAPEVKAASPYYRDPRLVPQEAIFDRETGGPVPNSALRSYADVLRGYHRSPESKFAGGGAYDIGPLSRRHVFASAVINIGKEADAFEEAEMFGSDEEDVTVYGASQADRESMIAEIKAAPMRQLKERAKLGHAIIGKARAADPTVATRTMNRLYTAALALRAEREPAEVAEHELCEWLRATSSEIGLSLLATRLRVDRSNLRKALLSGRLGVTLTQKALALRRSSDE